MALLIIATVCVFGVEAWRVSIFNANISKKETHTNIHYRDDQEPVNSYVLENIILEYINYKLSTITLDAMRIAVKDIGKNQYFFLGEKEAGVLEQLMDYHNPEIVQ